RQLTAAAAATSRRWRRTPSTGTLSTIGTVRSVRTFSARRGLLVEPLVEPVDVAIASVGIRDRRNRHDDVVPDLRDERRGFGREAVAELHQHLRRAGLAAVQAAHEVVLRLRGRDQLLDLIL